VGTEPELPDLPVLEAVPALRSALREERRALLVAPPGAGKTTLIPLLLLDEQWLDGQRIVLLEPRRLAARAAARRMADLRSEAVGGTVGLQTRDERRIGRSTRIEVLTEGVLTRRLQRDPTLDGVGLVIFDEVHERNLPTDLGLALTLEVVGSIRPDLRVLAMSATPDTARLLDVLDAPVVESSGRTFDIEIVWIPRTGTRPGRRTRPGGGARGGRIEPDVVAACLRALGDHDGDLLVFLPGIGEIRRVESQLSEVLGPGIDVRPLAGALTSEEQDLALRPSPEGRRRVVLTTDIAETSLTVDGVRIVVDGGLVREPRFDPATGMTRLTTVSNSRASAEQRAGRAGRTEPGVAYRLWSKIEHGSRPKHPTPEILQADLAGLALELAAWGGGDEVVFPDPPPPRQMQQARELLDDLHAVDEQGSITPLGRSMLGLPVHPRLARMIAVHGSALSCVVAALVDERDVLRGRPDELPADIALRIDVVTGRAGHDRADRNAVRRLRGRAEDIARRAGIDFDLTSVDSEGAGAALLLGFPDRLAGRRRPGQFTTRSGRGVWIRTEDPLAQESFIVAPDLDGRRDRARVRLAAALDASEVIHEFGPEVTERRTVSWDAERGDLVQTLERRLGAIELSRSTGPAEPGEETTSALMARVRQTKLDQLRWTDSARSLRARVNWLHRTIGDPWPDWTTATLVRSLDDWLAPYLPGATGRRDLESVDVGTVLRSQLPWPQGADLDDLAPPSMDLPTGRSIDVQYGDDGPTVSVRVQDLFGLEVHPTAGGQPIRLELLSPADRPIQVTSDLPGFWAGSWSQVRKDMAGRYPKHHWPEDPASAPPRRMGRD
jgi:ATP-dependent helicase HrpB